MSDLIIRSELYNLPIYKFGVSMLSAEEYIKVSDIEKMPTAYDIDKVVADISEIGCDYEAPCKRQHSCNGCDHYIIRCEDEIEIVKQEAENFGRDTNVGSDDWIPCSSGALPKSSNEYCVTKMCENDENPIYDTCNEIFWTIDNKWDCERDEFNEWKVIAWKQKEKPYRPKGE